MEIGIVILLKLITLHKVLFNPVLVSDWLLGIRIQFCVNA